MSKQSTTKLDKRKQRAEAAREKAEVAREKIKQSKESGVIKEFRDFINRGNVLDLAVGVIIGGAFQKIVSSLVDDIVMPIIGVLIGGIDFSDITITVPNFDGTTAAHVNIGIFLQNLVDFIIVAFVIFLVVKLINKFNKAKNDADDQKEADAKKSEDDQTALLKEIRDALVKKK